MYYMSDEFFTKTISLRISGFQEAAIKEAADQAGKSVSDYLRSSLGLDSLKSKVEQKLIEKNTPKEIRAFLLTLASETDLQRCMIDDEILNLVVKAAEQKYREGKEFFMSKDFTKAAQNEVIKEDLDLPEDMTYEVPKQPEQKKINMDDLLTEDAVLPEW